MEAADEVVSKRLRRHQQTNGNSEYYQQSANIIRPRPNPPSPPAITAPKSNGTAAPLSNRPFTIQSILDDAVASVVNEKLQSIRKNPPIKEFKPIEKLGNVSKLVESGRSAALAQRVKEEIRTNSKEFEKNESTTPSSETPPPGTSPVQFDGEDSNSSSPSTSRNRARGKRGQYRKYDKKALAEAVKSVRSGEMSVHKAGSYFGVPHSTLEYKVKERNLTRTKRHKKRSIPLGNEAQEGQQRPDSAASSPTRSSSVRLQSKTQAEVAGASSQPKGSKSTADPNQMAYGSYFSPWLSDWQTYAMMMNSVFGSGGYGSESNQNSFAASEMMKKLQEANVKVKVKDQR